MLTPIQSSYYEYIVERIEDGDPPSYADIAREFEVSRNTARTEVERLIEKGLLERKRYRGPLSRNCATD